MSLTSRKALPLAASLGLLFPLSNASQGIVSSLGVGLLAISLTGVTLVMACLIAVSSTIPQLEALERRLLALALLCVLTAGLSHVTLNASYSTDEAAFIHRAAQLFVRGQDPYGANLSSSLVDFGVPRASWTFLSDGGYLHTFPYPALPIILAAPIVALNSQTQVPVILGTLVLGIEMVVLFRVLPRPVRSAAFILCVAFPALSELADGGMSGVLLLPTLTFVAYRWREVAAGGRLGRGGWTRAIALGLALSANQLAWFVAPFVLGGMLLARARDLGYARAVRAVGAFAACSLGTFLLINAVFIVQGPSRWLSGVLKPFTIQAIPDGLGVISVSEYAHLGGGAVGFSPYVGALVFVGLLTLLAASFDRLHRWCFVLPLIALWFTERPMPEYWELVAPAVMVSVLSGGALRPSEQLPRMWRRTASYASASLLMAALAMLARIWLSPSPLQLRIEQAASGRTVSRLVVNVRNNSDIRLRPIFETAATNQASPFWTITTGIRELPPHATSTYVLAAPSASSQAAPGQTIVLEAITADPATISTSSQFAPQ
jgi:uncharacterized membrane protein